jgi:hypothetical protein
MISSFMFNFFIKRSKVTVDCFTNNINALEYFPVARASEFYPEWWKSLPKLHSTTDDNGLEIKRATMKSCDGFIDLYQQGLIIPLWSDLVIETMPNGFRYNFAEGGNNELGRHDYDQMSSEFMNYIHFKIMSPWRLQEKTDIKFLFFQPTYNNVSTLLDWHIMPGVVDFSYQHATNINILAPRGRRFEIAAGCPMAHVIPLTDKDVEIKTHFLDVKDMNHIELFYSNYPFFNGSYKKMKRLKREKNESKCPFRGFKK